MANKAILSVSGRDFNLLEFKLNLIQLTDNQGRPASGVFLGDFYFLMRGGNDLFLEWISEPTRMESGVIKTYRSDQESPFIEYSFVQGFVTTILENYFDNDGMDNAFNQVSEIEDSSEYFELWTRSFMPRGDAGKNDQDGHILGDSVAKARAFQQRTGIPYVLMVTLSSEKVTVRDIEHVNRWGSKR